MINSRKISRENLIPAACALAAFLAMTLLWVSGERWLYNEILWWWGFKAWPFPFLDFQNSLAAWDCERLGFEAQVSNPCDYLGRPYNYGPGWMDLSFIPLTENDNWWLSWLIGFSFIASIAFLPAVKGPTNVAIMTLAVLSPTTVFLVERANIDAIVFVMAVAAGHLVSRRPLISYGLIVLGAMFKYYPAVMLILALRERPLRFLTISVSAVAALGLYVLVYATEMRQGMAYIPNAFGSVLAFGSQRLPLAAEILLGIPAGAAMALIMVLLTIGALVILRSRALPDLAEIPERHQTFLVLGCVLIVGCFLAGNSISYRGVMFFFALPALLMMGRESMLARLTAGAIILILWEGLSQHLWGIDRGDRVMAAPLAHRIARELIWWFIISVLFALIAQFVGKRLEDYWAAIKMRGDSPVRDRGAGPSGVLSP